MSAPTYDLEEIEAAFKRAEEERAFWVAHHAELVAKYPGQFVAAKDGEFIDHDPDLMVLVHVG